MITAKQGTDRTKGIGSSDVPTILGLSPWSTPYDLWLMKTGQVPGVQENEAMRMGSMLEPAVLSLAAHRLGARVVKPTSTYIGAEPFMRANIDGMVGIAKRGSDIVEAKTTGRPDGWGEEGTDEIPEMVKAQVMFQMACASSGVAHVACLMGDYGLRLKMYRVAFCSDYAGYIDERIRAFWDCVQNRTAPEGCASLEMLKRVRRDAEYLAQRRGQGGVCVRWRARCSESGAAGARIQPSGRGAGLWGCCQYGFEQRRPGSLRLRRGARRALTEVRGGASPPAQKLPAGHSAPPAPPAHPGGQP
jgi:putative phage-type endonuclease